MPWGEATFADGFTQRDPVDGAAARDRTEVRVLLSGAAIYMGIRAYGHRSSSR